MFSSSTSTLTRSLLFHPLRCFRMGSSTKSVADAVKDSFSLLKKTNNTIDNAFEKSKLYRGEFEESKGGARPFDHYFDDNNEMKLNKPS